MRYSQHMTLAEYLKKHDMTDAEFAKRTGLHRSEVWHYRRGRMPRAPHLAKIEEVTRRQVQAKDF